MVSHGMSHNSSRLSFSWGNESQRLFGIVKEDVWCMLNFKLVGLPALFSSWRQWHVWISGLKVYETSKVASKSETDGVADAGGASFAPHPSLLWGGSRTPGWIFPSMRSLSECQQWCLITAQQTDHKSLPIIAQVYTLAPVIGSLKQQQ